MGFLSGVVKTASGIAKKSLGSVRKILDFNPTLSGLIMPPQVTMGFSAAKVVGGLVGIKVPDQNDLIGFAQGNSNLAPSHSRPLVLIEEPAQSTS